MYFEFPNDGVVLALDPAKRTGYARGRPRDTPTLGIVDFAREHDELIDIFGRAARWYADQIAASPAPALVVIEAVIAPMTMSGHTNYQTTAISHGLFGIFTGMARAKNIPVIEAPISTWRKYFLGRGKMRGEDAKRACVRLCRQLKWDAPDHNGAEAAGIWAWGAAQVEPARVRRIEPLFLTGSPE